MNGNETLRDALKQATADVDRLESELQESVNLSQSYLAELEAVQSELQQLENRHKDLENRLNYDLRFAAASSAMQGLLASWDSCSLGMDPSPKYIIPAAIQMADALLAALETAES